MGMRFVYPVVSRRAGGVSVGINLNPNHACNWQCVYCQVEGLQRGSAPVIDVVQLEDEFRCMLSQICEGDFMQERVPEDCRRLCDVAISGNGEPTSCRDFSQVVEVLLRVMDDFSLRDVLPLRLITNGSYVHKSHVQAGLRLMAQHHGEVWAKVDAGSTEAIARINAVQLKPERLAQQVVTVASLCPTWVQTCMFAWHGNAPSQQDVEDYVQLLKTIEQQQKLEGVLLYGVARPAMQEASQHVSALPEAVMLTIQQQIEAAGLSVSLSM